jgi:DNA helicase-2/ATP-dependent DNA helicase PcrA
MDLIGLTIASAINPQQAEIIDLWRQSLRVGQRTLADWNGGYLAVSAVPGAGKSHSMAIAAAITIARQKLHQRHQLAIVTLTRSAAANIKDKINKYLRELSLPPIGFTVSTIHSLALSIASKHPELSGLDLNDKTLIMPTVNHKLIKNTVELWLSRDFHRYVKLLEGQTFDGEETERLRRQSVIRTEVLPNLAFQVIREAKSSGLTPNDLWDLARSHYDEYDILGIGAGLYQAYQELLIKGNYLDYDEMILGALRVLQDPAAKRLWQQQIYGVFEDEAQDSSPLQEQLLRTLAGIPDRTDLPPNLIRVGDPNQAINSTFTPADPKYFREFCQQCADLDRLEKMQQAGRSTQVIIAAANYILQWGNRWLKEPIEMGERGDKDREIKGTNIADTKIPNSQLPTPNSQLHNSEAVFWLQDILPVSAGDPQPNPAQEGKGLELVNPSDIYESIDIIAARLIKLLSVNPDANAAILVRENRHAKFIFDRLTERLRNHPELRIYEAGESDRTSRIPAEMLTLLQFMNRPHSPEYLKAALKVLLERKVIEAQDIDALAVVPEKFLYPSILESPPTAVVKRAQIFCGELLRARLTLPHYQLIKYLADRLDYQASELATADKLADRVALQTYDRSSLNSTIEVLQEIVNTEGFENIDDGAEARYTAKGQITLITMHKSKGLDWDYVFIPFLSDRIPGELWTPQGAKFLGDFTLAEVARAKIRAHLHQLPIPSPQQAWKIANYLKQAEELRLLYVAMTRAKKLLWMATEQQAPFLWNRFNWQQGDKLQEGKPSPVFIGLRDRF